MTTDIKVKVERQGNWIVFTTDVPVTKDQARDLQMNHGYHPSGYGFSFPHYEDEATSWKCFNSCD